MSATSTAGASPTAQGDTFVEVRDLKRVFDVSKPWLNRILERQDKQFLKAVDGVSFHIQAGRDFRAGG